MKTIRERGWSLFLLLLFIVDAVAYYHNNNKGLLYMALLMAVMSVMAFFLEPQKE